MARTKSLEIVSELVANVLTIEGLAAPDGPREVRDPLGFGLLVQLAKAAAIVVISGDVTVEAGQSLAAGLVDRLEGRGLVERDPRPPAVRPVSRDGFPALPIAADSGSRCRPAWKPTSTTGPSGGRDSDACRVAIIPTKSTRTPPP